MTLKIYKKTTRWYFTYHQVEKQLSGNLECFVDHLGDLLGQKVIYITIDVNPTTGTYGLALLYERKFNWETVTYGLYGKLRGFFPSILNFNEGWPTINLPSKWMNHGTASLYIKLK